MKWAVQVQKCTVDILGDTLAAIEQYKKIMRNAEQYTLQDIR